MAQRGSSSARGGISPQPQTPVYPQQHPVPVSSSSSTSLGTNNNNSKNSTRITQLENLLQEFFTDDACSTLRRRDIECSITTLFSGPDRWELLAEAIQHTRSAYVLMICLNQLELGVTSSVWSSSSAASNTLSRDFKRSVMDFCFTLIATGQPCEHFYIALPEQQHAQSNKQPIPSFIKQKLCRVIVELGKRDWSDDTYPEFFDNITRLICQNNTGQWLPSNTTLLPRIEGLQLLRICIEEFLAFGGGGAGGNVASTSSAPSTAASLDSHRRTRLRQKFLNNVVMPLTEYIDTLLLSPQLSLLLAENQHPETTTLPLQLSRVAPVIRELLLAYRALIPALPHSFTNTTSTSASSSNDYFIRLVHDYNHVYSRCIPLSQSKRKKLHAEAEHSYDTDDPVDRDDDDDDEQLLCELSMLALTCLVERISLPNFLLTSITTTSDQQPTTAAQQRYDLICKCFQLAYFLMDSFSNAASAATSSQSSTHSSSSCNSTTVPSITIWGIYDAHSLDVNVNNFKLVFREFLSILMSKFFHRMQTLTNDTFPSHAFLSKVAQFTLAQVDQDVYVAYLQSIWHNIIDWLLNEKEQNNQKKITSSSTANAVDPGESCVVKFRSAILDFQTSLLARISFQLNCNMLEELDDEPPRSISRSNNSSASNHHNNSGAGGNSSSYYCSVSPMLMVAGEVVGSSGKQQNLSGGNMHDGGAAGDHRNNSPHFPSIAASGDSSNVNAADDAADAADLSQWKQLLLDELEFLPVGDDAGAGDDFCMRLRSDSADDGAVDAVGGSPLTMRNNANAVNDINNTSATSISELDRIIRETLNVVGAIAEIYPQASFEKLLNGIVQACTTIEALYSTTSLKPITSSKSSALGNVDVDAGEVAYTLELREMDANRAFCALKDAKTNLRAFQRFLPLLGASAATETSSSASMQQMFQRLISLALMCTQVPLWQRRRVTHCLDTLRTAFADAHYELLATLMLLCGPNGWLSQQCAAAADKKAAVKNLDTENFMLWLKTCLNDLLNLILQLILSNSTATVGNNNGNSTVENLTQRRLQLAAAHLFCTLTKCVRAPFLRQIPSVLTLLQCAASECSACCWCFRHRKGMKSCSVPSAVAECLAVATSNIILLPYNVGCGDDVNDEAEGRSRHEEFGEFLRGAILPLLHNKNPNFSGNSLNYYAGAGDAAINSVTNSAENSQDDASVAFSLYLLSAILRNFSHESLQTKTVISECLVPIFDLIILQTNILPQQMRRNFRSTSVTGVENNYPVAFAAFLHLLYQYYSVMPNAVLLQQNTNSNSQLQMLLSELFKNFQNNNTHSNGSIGASYGDGYNQNLLLQQQQTASKSDNKLHSVNYVILCSCLKFLQLFANSVTLNANVQSVLSLCRSVLCPLFLASMSSSSPSGSTLTAEQQEKILFIIFSLLKNHWHNLFFDRALMNPAAAGKVVNNCSGTTVGNAEIVGVRNAQDLQLLFDCLFAAICDDAVSESSPTSSPNNMALALQAFDYINKLDNLYGLYSRPVFGAKFYAERLALRLFQMLIIEHGHHAATLRERIVHMLYGIVRSNGLAVGQHVLPLVIKQHLNFKEGESASPESSAAVATLYSQAESTLLEVAVAGATQGGNGDTEAVFVQNMEYFIADCHYYRALLMPSSSSSSNAIS